MFINGPTRTGMQPGQTGHRFQRLRLLQGVDVGQHSVQ